MRSEVALREFARKMRRNPTEPEKRLWRHLSNAQLSGHKFRRQAAMPPYVVDFFCPAKGLIVEVDGHTHDTERDTARDLYFLREGLSTLRVSNADVMTNMEGVLRTIRATLERLPDRWKRPERSPHPNPSPEGEGLK